MELPLELGPSKSLVSKLLKLLYCLVEEGRQFVKVTEATRLHEHGFKTLLGVSQLYMKKDREDNIILIATKVTDNTIIASKIIEHQQFSAFLSQRYKVHKGIIYNIITLNGCDIHKECKGSITILLIK